MNGLPMTAEQRAARKRQLQEELMVVRQQKADVLRQIQQIAKKQRTGPPPPRIGGLSPEARRQEVEVEHHRRKDAIWQGCLKIMQELLKNSTVKSYFGEPVRTDYAPMYYDVIKRPMDLGTIKRTLPSFAACTGSSCVASRVPVGLRGSIFVAWQRPPCHQTARCFWWCDA